MEIYSKFLNKTFRLDQDQETLLLMVANLGYVTKKQSDLLWSAIKGEPSKFPNVILSGWIKKGGLLVGSYKSIIHANRTFFYYPSNLFWRTADEHNLPVYYGLSGNNIRFNSHNIAAIDVVVQGIYTSVLKAPLWYLMPSGKNKQVPSGEIIQNKSGSNIQAPPDLNIQIPSGEDIQVPPGSNPSRRINQIPSSNLNQIPSESTNQESIQSIMDKAVNMAHKLRIQRWTNDLGREYISFVPDEVITLDNNIICIELDNKTESNQVQVDKLNNYLKYASAHPDKIVQVIFAVNDYSNPRLSHKYVQPYIKLSNQIHAFLTGESNYLGEIKRYITEGMINTPNLEIYVCGTDEADIAVAEAIHNKSFGRPNWNDQECLEAADVINKMKFKADYIGRRDLQRTTLGRCILNMFTKYEDHRSSRLGKNNSYLAGVMKIRSEEYDNDNSLYYMPVIAGLEHSLYTQFAIRQIESKKGTNLLYDLQIKANKGDLLVFGLDDPDETIKGYMEESKAHILASPIVIYPRRERSLIPALDTEVNKIHSKSSNFTSNSISRYSPRYTLEDDPLIEYELNILKNALGLKQKYFFDKTDNMQNYKKGIRQTNFVLTPIDPYLERPREFDYLHSLAGKYQGKEFSLKLRLTEIPLQMYEDGFFARNELAHATPFIFQPKTDSNWQMPDDFSLPEDSFYNAASNKGNRFVHFRLYK